ncbi:MAG: hypothetical protein MHPSP_003592, partial [Paramarteilia canceri]
ENYFEENFQDDYTTDRIKLYAKYAIGLRMIIFYWCYKIPENFEIYFKDLIFPTDNLMTRMLRIIDNIQNADCYDYHWESIKNWINDSYMDYQHVPSRSENEYSSLI